MKEGGDMSQSPHTASALSVDDGAPVLALSHWGSHSGGDETPSERLAVSELPVFLIPDYTTPSQLGSHSDGANPLERLRSWSLEKEYVFDRNSGTLF
jgi:hypothetical protein